MRLARIVRTLRHEGSPAPGEIEVQIGEKFADDIVRVGETIVVSFADLPEDVAGQRAALKARLCEAFLLAESDGIV